MTTEILSDPPLSEEQVSIITEKNHQNELKWLTRSIIRPQLPELREELKSCLRQISEDNETVFKLPLTSHKSEMLKGTISRQNVKIIGLNVDIKAKTFNGGKTINMKLKDSNHPIVIRQLLDCHDCIYNALKMIDKICEFDALDDKVFLTYMNKLYLHICAAKKALDCPNVAYIFPNYRVASTLFEPEMSKHMSLDFFVNSGELTVDFQSLKHVTQRPWSTILNVKSHQSFADHVRAKISRDRHKSVHQIIIDEYQKLLQWQKTLSAEGVDKESTNTTGGNENNKSTSETIRTALKSIFVPNGDPSLSTLLKSASKYLEQCITYQDNDKKPYVVTVLDKCEMVTSDPILLSLSIKLDSLEKAVNRLYRNLHDCAST